LKTPPVERMAFEASVLPHLDAAYNLARWLLRNEDDAKDVVQDAYLRPFASTTAFGAATAAVGCSRSYGTPVTRGFDRLGRTR